MRTTAVIIGAVMLGLWTGVALAEAESADETIGRTPPRLSYIDGQVSFWRPGAEDWVQAQINTALAPGDQLFVSGAGNLELQIGSQAFVRAGADTQISLETREPDFLRFKLTSGTVVFDIRSLAPGRTIEAGTVHAALTIDQEGYYRLNVDEARTTLVTRRNGRADVRPAGLKNVSVQGDESVVVHGPSDPSIAFQPAPQLDDWDNWNYARTDQLLEAQSVSYVSPDTYGSSDLDRYGSWRTLPDYGSVWVPSGVSPDWAPYSTGSWMYDPYYGWTWVDTAPWGWAPYHYGRWIHANGYWCWAPGPVIRRAVYAPALVAFLNRPGLSVGINIGGPAVGWVCLGWGEPLVPWWGRPGFIHRPWWGGWGGPRFVNNKVIHHRTIVEVEHIHHYHNTRVHRAVVAVNKEHFGRGPINRHYSDREKGDAWRPMHQAPHVRPTAASYVPPTRRGPRPSDKDFRRPMVTHDLSKKAAPASERTSITNHRQTARPDLESGVAERKQGPSQGNRAPKVFRNSPNPPAQVSRPGAAGTTAHEGRIRPGRSTDSQPGAQERLITRPPEPKGREGAAGKIPLQRLKPQAGPTMNSMNGNPSRAAEAPAHPESAAPVNRPRLKAGRPVQQPANQSSAIQSPQTLSPGPVVRAPERPNSRQVETGGSRVVSPQAPAGRPETQQQSFRNGSGRIGSDGSAPGSGYRESRQSGRNAWTDRGNRPDSGFRYGLERRTPK